MLIASHFKRPNAPVNLPNSDGTSKDYFFRPIDPNSPESEHVAEVTDSGHIQKLLAIAEGYYIADANAIIDSAKAAALLTERPSVVQPAVPVPDPASQVATQVQPDGTVPQGGVPADATATTPAAATTSSEADAAAAAKVEDSALTEAAKALLALPLAKFKAALKTEPRSVLARALALESDKGNDERATVVKHLQAALA